MGTDADWERWGASDPYFGVLSRERFRRGEMDDANRAEFFKSGEAYVTNLLDTIDRTFDGGIARKRALDFGCGVGRLTIPLARRMEHVTGVDISPSMIAEAKRNCGTRDIHDITFVPSDDGLAHITGSFDLVHSYLVMQHIPWRRGRHIIAALADRVAPCGVLAIHIFTGYRGPRLVRALVRLRYAVPPLNWLRNIVRGRPIFEPAMQLHVYDVEAIRRHLERQNFAVSMIPHAHPAFHALIICAQRIGRDSGLERPSAHALICPHDRPAPPL